MFEAREAALREQRRQKCSNTDVQQILLLKDLKSKDVERQWTDTAIHRGPNALMISTL